MLSEHNLTSGEWLRWLRIKHNFTQEKLAEEIKTTKTTINQWENNRLKGNIKASYITALADLYGVSVDYILQRSDFTHDGNQYISEVTGLSDEAINVLRKVNIAPSVEKQYFGDFELSASAIINAAVSDKNFSDLLSHIQYMISSEEMSQHYNCEDKNKAEADIRDFMIGMVFKNQMPINVLTMDENVEFHKQAAYNTFAIILENIKRLAVANTPAGRSKSKVTRNKSKSPVT